MRKENLFPDLSPGSPADRVRSSLTKIRNLRSQVGHDGLTPSGTRTLIDELTRAMEEIARALDTLEKEES